MNYLFKIVTIFLFVLGLVSCSPTSEESVDSQLDRIQVRLDQRDWSGGLSALDKIILKYPRNNRARAIKASLFLNQAYVQLADYISLEKAIFESVDIPPEKLQELRKQVQDGIQNKDLSNSILEAALKLEEFKIRLKMIPLFDKDQVQNISLALQELSLMTEPSSGQALFRLSLRLFLFRYFLATQVQSIKLNSLDCENTLMKIPERLGQALSWISTIYDDAGLVFKDKQKQISQDKVSAELGFNLLINSLDFKLIKGLNLCN